MLVVRAKMRSPRLFLGLGLFLMLLGIALPFAMVIHVIESTFFLNFFSWGASVVGLALSMIGIVLLRSTRK